ncbi:MAG TPA: Na/Pi cotransporter family protein [Candidatus Eisenbergiella merdigallinarum]|uniref:Na/Pi cotransporter family protein n=1 Tax=Candidatus Eisenbergiella merdigallinarum TaxID=2838552 RepID=A0A9D2MT38_9FIRM|nr:Na/Pi cotransporter family protein [Candidatus Eisenbergiella merdigallinarum]
MGIEDVSMLFTFIGGLGMFLYGMHIMAEGLQHFAGGRMQKLMGFLTRNRIMAILVGTVVTAVIQSSSATTVMVVGFVNAGMLNLSQAVGVIMGANIGTTVTAWIVSMSEWGSVLKPEFFAPLLVGIGAFVVLFVKSDKKKRIGEILIGFAILFIGLTFMSDAILPYRESPVFSTAFTVLGKNPILAVLAGAVVTAIIQSSSASVGILQTLAMNGIVGWNSAIFITLGQNIGTCVTALLSSAGAGRNGKRASVIHLAFNVCGAVIFGILMYVLFVIFPDWGNSTITSVEISVFHTVFNVSNTILLLPFADRLVTLSGKLVRGEDEAAPADGEREAVRKLSKRLDRRLLNNPSFALAAVQKEVAAMGRTACANLESALEAVRDGNMERVQGVFEKEKDINGMEKALTAFLVEVDNLSLTEFQHEQVKNLFYTVSDIERAGDHAENIAELAESMNKDQVTFSKKGRSDLELIAAQTLQSLQIAVEARENGEAETANSVHVLEQSVDMLEDELREKHIRRLSKGKCDPESGVIFLDIISNLERIADHAVNIADYVASEAENPEGAVPAQR